MSPVIPFRRRSNLPRFLILLGAVAAAVIGFAATMGLLEWQSRRQQTHVVILGPTPNSSSQIDVETARSNGVVYRVFSATMAFLGWPQQPRVVVLRPDPRTNPTPTQSGQIEVIDGDTVRLQGVVYRLVGFDTPERGDKARCDDERRRAEAATMRLRALIGSADARLTRVACACQAGQEGTRNCNYGRLCGSLSIREQDVAAILIGEGLAHPYVCSSTSCPRRRPWC